jgi:predicted adenine nucleotide alpha hydrolase (AANH) superfamily ATPase
MANLHAANIDFTVFFYNPNIHPVQEYELRKAENKRFADKNAIPFVDADYDVDYWFSRIRGLEHEPERGERCTRCFDIRLEKTAHFAHDNGFSLFTSSLGISRWKNMAQVNECGIRAANVYKDLIYWTFNWRKQGGSEQMVEIAKREEFYRQGYCGCIYSLRDSTSR